MKVIVVNKGHNGKNRPSYRYETEWPDGVRLPVVGEWIDHTGYDVARVYSVLWTKPGVHNNERVPVLTVEDW